VGAINASKHTICRRYSQDHDLVHSWATLLMVGGPRVVARFGRVFWWLVGRYDHVASLSPDLMAGQYYWLR
jgi:hypothetical protein